MTGLLCAPLMTNAQVPLLGFAAYSGVGKTTLLTRLIPLLARRGIKVGVIKHGHHDFDIDHPGKDSHWLRQAGASPVMIVSSRRRAIITELNPPHEPDLNGQLPHFDQTGLDLLLVEGFKHEPFPKIEIHRPSLGKPPLFPDDPCIIAIACDGPMTGAGGLPVLDLNRPEQVAGFIAAALAAGQPGPNP